MPRRKYHKRKLNNNTRLRHVVPNEKHVLELALANTCIKTIVLHNNELHFTGELRNLKPVYTKLVAECIRIMDVQHALAEKLNPLHRTNALDYTLWSNGIFTQTLVS